MLTLSVNGALIANSQELVWLVGQIDNTGEFDFFSVLIFVDISRALLLSNLIQVVVEINISILTTRCETEVVLEPVNTGDSVEMTLKCHV